MFGVIVMVWIIWGTFYPNPHPRFEIAPGAQQAGAMTGEIAMVILSLAYAYAMVFGRKVKKYFSLGKERGRRGRGLFDMQEFVSCAMLNVSSCCGRA
ncbi:hypothetical protein ACPPVV_16775 [Rhodanobacter sp. Col0626]|uniref:hypothetical protein n=1 Tax=Rhodanobacter sp. Col0626 TaxID=3415679 RepID=UPI003CF4157A